MTEPVVLFNAMVTASSHCIGVATLNVPASLNALSLEMIELLAPQLEAWAVDERVVAVVLQGAGDKAFCAGGDLRPLYRSIRECGGGLNVYAERYFAKEYALDHLIHRYPKPLLCWGHGIVMGGGLGLMAGASQRVVTLQSRIAMPEISIGLYPDVGGSWFLPRMPGRIGLFLALTGAPLNAADAMYCGLADAVLLHEQKAELMQMLADAPWQARAPADAEQLAGLLRRAGEDVVSPLSHLREHQATIDALMAGDDLNRIAEHLRNLQSEDPWLQAVGRTFAAGSPTSAALSFVLQRRARGLSLADVFRLEYWASLGCCAHSDFAEGIRALLIDKDHQPKWSPATLGAVTPQLIDDHVRPRGEHPSALTDLQ